MPPKFFITHSWKDIEFARRLFKDLTAQGLEGFLDEKTLQGGHRLAEEINRGLEWCDIYIPILSRAALESPWCWEEINAAIALSNRRDRTGRPRIISILVEECVKAMPAVLSGRLYFDFSKGYIEGFRGLVVNGFQINLKSVDRKKVPRIIRTSVKDGKEMVLIPAGTFIMGSNESNNQKTWSHEVYLNAFWIDRYPITNVEYAKFVEATNYEIPRHWHKNQIPSGKEFHPVVYVNWCDAVAYAEWAGKRLPTEAEWEKTASWDDAKKHQRRYPWGNGFNAKKCNSGGSIGSTTRVGEYSPRGDSAFGVGDMAGNVWEWCADWYDENYYKNSPLENPKGSETGNLRVLRGGSWTHRTEYARTTFRYHAEPGSKRLNVGFRCAEDFR